MCTAINIGLDNGYVYFGRTMDFSHELDPELYYVPAGYQWRNLLDTDSFKTKYSFLGIGQDISPIVLTDGVNEKGLAIAALYFPGFAQYDDVNANDLIPIAAFELVYYLLSQCQTVEEVQKILETIRIVGVEDDVTHTVAPLHWIMNDQSNNCMVIEKTAQGLQIINNPIGVLSNSPDFSWHLNNLRNYLNLSPYQQESNWGNLELIPFGQGAGTLGLPGDYTPPSRFVRAAFQKTFTDMPLKQQQTIMTCFRIMETVSIPKGTVITARHTPDYTQYTMVIDITTQTYYFKTYWNNQITKVEFPEYSVDNLKIISLGRLNEGISFKNRSIFL